ncbi:hypothetical protein ET475_05680 [Microbacterium protaetiae]|uniref:Nucleotidyltransferase n=1 Tax=Microbacterium protaetiae TaxID=2509458 RepID=A0A4P6EJC4_9MICO|nr:hypothetical protein ET475_05680 [Microbacterium protaetiae]
MNDATVRARSVLLDALDALEPHLPSVILIGAQAVYLHTGGADVALAEFTTDADVAIDVRTVSDDPLIEQAMLSSGFVAQVGGSSPGTWMSPTGVHVDLMVPDAIAGAGRRGVTAPPHDRRSMRRTVGIEPVLVDNTVMTVGALSAEDRRTCDVRVAGPAALLIAKVHKVAERRDNPLRRDNKDAHDIFRLLVAIETSELAREIGRLLGDEVSVAATRKGLRILEELFAKSSDALGARMAGAAEVGIGDPEQTAVAVSLLAADLVAAVEGLR